MQTQRSIRLNAPTLQAKPVVGGAGAELDSAYVALGSRQTRPGGLVPISGSGTLIVQAGLIDLVGTTVLSGFGKADLASSGDLRLEGIRTAQDQRDLTGEFRMAGDFNLTANQVYPTTLSEFRIALEGAPGRPCALRRGMVRARCIRPAENSVSMHRASSRTVSSRRLWAV